MKDKMNDAKEKAKTKVRERTTEHWEKKRTEYDESNFNYAISFLDNTGLFESDEKGNAFTSTVLNTVKLANNEEKSLEDRAYTNLKNGEILMAGNKFGMAEKSFKLSKVLYEQDAKTNSINYSQAVSDLGLLYQSRGRYSKAKEFNEQAIKLREQAQNTGMLIVSINNNAVLKKETGNYAEAADDLNKALKMALNKQDTLAIALINNNLAMTYLDMNKTKDAEKYMIESVNEAAKVLKENSGNLIKLKINLANIYRLQKKYPEAEKIYLNAIYIKEKKLGSHPDLAHLKKGLAQLYMDMNRPTDVEKLLVSAYDINKRKLGESNPATLSVQQELANFYRYNNNASKSLALLLQVVDKKKAIYGESHPNYIQALEDLSLTLWQNNKIEDASAGYKVVIDNTLSYIQSFFNSLNDNEKTLYWDKTNNRLQRYFNFCYQNIKSNPQLLNEFYATVINTKGFLLNNSSKIKNTILSSNDESLKNTYNKWLEAKENLNAAFQLSSEELANEHINLDSLKKSAEFLERELSQKSSVFAEGNAKESSSSEQIQNSLLQNEAAVEIIEINEFINSFTGSAHYVAVVVKRDEIKIVELGKDEEISKAVSEFRTKTIDQKPENEAYGLTWKLLDAELADVKKIYLSLDGIYHQLSINSLKDATGKYLVDKYSIQLVGNSRDIIALKENEKSAAKPSSAFLIGNPLYGANGVVAQLPGTEAEVKNITKLLSAYKVKCAALYGKEATESRVKQLSSPGILHIATHGYFLTDVSAVESNKILGVDINAAKENPLLRSGILLANCENVFDPDYHAGHNTENGVLTAYEAMSLNLDKTDLVVLSACETGLGSVRQGEGVYGLQRAFLIAGTKSIIMSLWSVSDEATMELMTLFYTNYAKTGNKADAFNTAIKQLKTKYKEPFYWGAFVMLSR
jgi:CHAT domain-containing protein/tetratricopeptide (TPR) repeat protein